MEENNQTFHRPVCAQKCPIDADCSKASKCDALDERREDLSENESGAGGTKIAERKMENITIMSNAHGRSFEDHTLKSAGTGDVFSVEVIWLIRNQHADLLKHEQHIMNKLS